MIKARAEITLTTIRDIKAVYRYYILQPSTLNKPIKPTISPPEGNWMLVEPNYIDGSTNSLFFVDCTIFCDDTFSYSEVSLSTSYEAAKTAWNKANNAEINANTNGNKIDEVIENFNSEFEKTNSELSAEVSKRTASDKEIENLSTKISANEESVKIEFSNIVKSINNTNIEIEEQKSYINFDSGKIIVGNDNSPMRTEQTNDCYTIIANDENVASFDAEGTHSRNVDVDNQVKYNGQWATRRGARNSYGYNLNDVWIG